MTSFALRRNAEKLWAVVSVTRTGPDPWIDHQVNLTAIGLYATAVTDELELESEDVTQRRTVWDYATTALREKSQSVLHGGLIWSLRAYDGRDARDLMLSLAPFHDCARRLGLDVSQVFNDAADVVGGDAGELARVFGTRTDVTPDAFAYAVESAPDGPKYRSQWPNDPVRSQVR